ncbi:hypothetical protein GQ44DRAFT_732732 [Phaeosphaeriaceae sp. PMI808]|nr:hypothetical protein GQ44DRAFT_732732 [Phaeosphaeriaceae sp. PMI808]
MCANKRKCTIAHYQIRTSLTQKWRLSNTSHDAVRRGTVLGNVVHLNIRKPLYKRCAPAVVVSKQGAGADVVFEVFELSPPNETVMRTKGRLKRSFPTYACQISLQQFQEEGLIESLAHTLGKMSCEEAPGFQPQTCKNKKDHNETRDTTHPGLITDFFMHLLSVVGQPTDVQGVWKNTREDVIWMSDCTSAVRPIRYKEKPRSTAQEGPINSRSDMTIFGTSGSTTAKKEKRGGS